MYQTFAHRFIKNYREKKIHDRKYLSAKLNILFKYQWNLSNIIDSIELKKFNHLNVEFN